VWFSLRTDFSEERIASVIRVARIGKLGTLAVTSNDTFLRNAGSHKSHAALTSQMTAFFTVLLSSPGLIKVYRQQADLIFLAVCVILQLE
jgi:hypothetical protein